MVGSLHDGQQSLLLKVHIWQEGNFEAKRGPASDDDYTFRLIYVMQCNVM